MSSFCNAKATHIFSAKKFQLIYVSLDVNFNESLTNDVVSFEQLSPFMMDCYILYCKLSRVTHVVGEQIAKYKFKAAKPE